MAAFFNTAFKLSRAGVLGLNARNYQYIQKYNSRLLYPLVDNKLETKKLANRFGLKTPDLYGVIRYNYEIKTFAKAFEAHNEFVIKPTQGSGGNGILVISGRQDEHYIKASGAVFTESQMERYLSNVLSGLHSLGGRLDAGMVEYRIIPEDMFRELSYQGVPDVRILVFQGFPVMGMLRLSTSASDGKANLHQGAVGVGLDLATGRALRAVQKDRMVDRHPDTNTLLATVQIPNWEELIHIASRCYESTGLGYLGVDLVVDREKGPLILEMNARPGLGIQTANGFGLLPRLRWVESYLDHHPLPSPEERIKMVKDQFGNESY